MNSLAFLLLLGSFGFVVYWYVVNAETERDGTEGLLRLKSEDDEESLLKSKTSQRYSPLPENIKKVKEQADRARALNERRKQTTKHFRLKSDDETPPPQS